MASKKQTMSKNEYLQTVLDIQIAALKSAQAPFKDSETGEVDQVMAARVTRSEVLIGLLMKAKHLVKINEGKEYRIFLTLRKPTLRERLAAWVTKKSYIYTKEYMNRFLGSIRWSLQDINADCEDADSIMPVRSLQKKIKVLKEERLPKTSGLVKLDVAVRKL